MKHVLHWLSASNVLKIQVVWDGTPCRWIFCVRSGVCVVDGGTVGQGGYFRGNGRDLY